MRCLCPPWLLRGSRGRPPHPLWTPLAPASVAPREQAGGPHCSVPGVALQSPQPVPPPADLALPTSTLAPTAAVPPTRGGGLSPGSPSLPTIFRVFSAPCGPQPLDTGCLSHRSPCPDTPEARLCGVFLAPLCRGPLMPAQGQGLPLQVPEKGAVVPQVSRAEDLHELSRSSPPSPARQPAARTGCEGGLTSLGQLARRGAVSRTMAQWPEGLGWRARQEVVWNRWGRSSPGGSTRGVTPFSGVQTVLTDTLPQHPRHPPPAPRLGMLAGGPSAEAVQGPEAQPPAP